MTYVPFDSSTLPARIGRKAGIDPAEADALYDLVVKSGAISDGNLYKEETKARVAAARAKRTLVASPKFQASGKVARTRVGTPTGQDGFAFEVKLGEPRQK